MADARTLRLIDAVRDHNVAAIRELVAKGADCNGTDDYDVTPFMSAVVSRDLEIITLLLSLGADPNASDENGGTPLMWAAEGGDVKVVELLLSSGATLNARRADGHTALSLAMAKETGGAVQLLEKAGAGADVHAQNAARWRHSGQPESWVEEHQGAWTHDEWLALSADAQRSTYWPMQIDMVGSVMEELKRAYWKRHSAASRASTSTKGLGLADPHHVARREVENTSKLADKIIAIGHPEMFECSTGPALQLVRAIEKASEKAPDDLDLLGA